MTDKNWGASQEDWFNFSVIHGIEEDLLPVVSNLTREISKQSNIKSIGKVPSVVNRGGYVAGFPKWAQHLTTPKHIADWQSNPDYGISINCRNVRGIDADIDNPELAKKVLEALDEVIGQKVPIRWRKDSPRFLLMVRVEGVVPYSCIKLDTEKAGDAIEFLGNGRQFIALGTHAKGARYEIDWRDCTTFPTMSIETFDTIIKFLHAKFGEGDLVGRTHTERKQLNRVDIQDENTQHLDILGEGKDGQLYIECPFVENHSSDTGVAQTCYFPKGTKGYDQGHFFCLHLGCADKTDRDFENALGLIECDFDKVPVVVNKEGVELPPVILDRNKSGQALATMSNVSKYLNRADKCGMHIRFDEFKDELMVASFSDGDYKLRMLSDIDYAGLRIMFDDSNFKPVGKDMVRDAVEYVADANRFDSAQEWLTDLVWDGVPRVRRFVADYLDADDDDDYAVAVSLYLWTALAGRILEPAVKADMVPILIGDQGARKSTAVACIAPDKDLFTEVCLGENDADLARRMCGRLIAEIPELKGLHSRDINTIKAFIARQEDEWVPKYKERVRSYKRRLLFVGTSNEDAFLADSTGNRRWLPFKVGTCDTDKITADRDQLWAEGRELFKKHGVLYREAERLGKEKTKNFAMVDSWEEVVTDWLHRKDDFGKQLAPVDRAYLRMSDVITSALGLDRARINRSNEHRVGVILKSAGYQRVRRRIGEVQPYVWVRTEKGLKV